MVNLITPNPSLDHFWWLGTMIVRTKDNTNVAGGRKNRPGVVTEVSVRFTCRCRHHLHGHTGLLLASSEFYEEQTPGWPRRQTSGTIR